MTIVLLVEGATEAALKSHLKRFLDNRAMAAGKRKVRLQTRQHVVTESAERLGKRVKRELRQQDVVGVVALIDAYPSFSSHEDPAEAAKEHLRQAAGGDPRFFPHVALHEVEAWLLPYWDSICNSVGVRRAMPGASPEAINGTNPPSQRLKELYRVAGRKYVKTIEMNRILDGKDLAVAAERCPEFKSFLNTLLLLNGLAML